MMKFKLMLGIFAVCLLAFAVGCTSKSDNVQSQKNSGETDTEKLAQNDNGNRNKPAASNSNGRKRQSSKRKKKKAEKSKNSTKDEYEVDPATGLPPLQSVGAGGGGKGSNGDSSKIKKVDPNRSFNKKNKSGNGGQTKKSGNNTGGLSVSPDDDNGGKTAKSGGQGNNTGGLSVSPPGGDNFGKKNKKRGKNGAGKNQPPPPGSFAGGSGGGGGGATPPGSFGAGGGGGGASPPGLGGAGPGGGGRPGGSGYGRNNALQGQIAATVQSFVSAVADNKLKTVNQFILKRAKGDLRSLRAGKLSKSKLNKIQGELKGLTLVTAARADRRTGGQKIIYKNENGQTVSFLLRKGKDKKFQIREMKVSRAR